MKLPIKWLKEYVDTKLTAEKIAEKLTMTGLEVEEISGGQNFTSVVVGHVLSVEKHPNADKLNVAIVDIGDKKLQIVCGATNLDKGQNVPVALVGAKLGDYDITKATLRGVDSYGMICSERELGISDEHAGIMVLNKKTIPGTDVSQILGGERVLDVKVLANRSDCMSVVGLAREVAVVTNSNITIPAIKLAEKSNTNDFTIEIENKDLCPRYIARFVEGLKSASTPEWMKECLVSCGVRPISLFVDISNYVMLEYGQPLHFFDLDKLKEKKIVVRSAKVGEELTTLDGIKRKLTKDNLVITDGKSPIALAGVMGGATTEIDDDTKNILIEAAVFDKASIRRTSRALGLRSEAVARFEKGISLGLPDVAIDRAVQLLHDLGKGTISKTKIDISDTKTKIKSINLDIAKMNTFLGTDILEKEAIDILQSLGFKTTKVKNGFEVESPYWRIDIVEDVDLYEEVIRIIGYDRVPYTLPFNVQSIPEKNKYFEIVGKIRERLSSVGFDEVLTYSFMGEKELGAIGLSVTTAPEIQNPLVSDQQYLRQTLVPKMLEAIKSNQYNKEVLRFFEIGRSFEKVTDGKLPKETNWLSMGLNTDYYDVKGAIYNLLSGFGIEEDEIVIKTTTSDFIKKGIGADLFVQGKKLATIGEVKEAVKESFDIKKPVVVALLNIDLLLSLNLPEVKFVQFSKYQQVTRDISVIFDDEITVSEIRKNLSRVDRLITKIEVIDIYKGKGLDTNKRSISIRFYIQSDDHTLTDLEVDETMKIVHNKITKLGGKLRSGS